MASSDSCFLGVAGKLRLAGNQVIPFNPKTSLEPNWRVFDVLISWLPVLQKPTNPQRKRAFYSRFFAELIRTTKKSANLALMRKIAALCLPNPWHHNSDKNNSNSNKKFPQNPVNQQHSNQQVEQSEQENFFTAFYQSPLESFLGEIYSIFCAATFLGVLEENLVSFDFFGWMKWRLFWGEFEGFMGFWKPVKFWWIICGIFLGSWTGLGCFGIWEWRFLLTRNTKNRFSSHFGPPETKN